MVSAAMAAKRKRKPPVIDLGTPEAQKKRLELVGGGDPTMAAYPLGILLSRQYITQDQHNAGMRYAGLAKEILRLGPRQPTSGNEPDEKAAVRMLAEWRSLCTYLLSVSREVKEATDEVCVYERPANVVMARIGLSTLQKVFYGQRRH
jgi:hypothetical protein